jgi:hypothetical protein
VRFSRRVAEYGGTLRQAGGHEGVLRSGDAGLIQEYVGTFQLAAEDELVPQLDLGAESLECLEVGIETSPPDHISTRWRQAQLVRPGQHRPCQEDRRTNTGGEFGLQRGGSHVPGPQG